MTKDERKKELAILSLLNRRATEFPTNKISKYRKTIIKRYLCYRDGPVCRYCHKYLNYSAITIDHIHARSIGGTNHLHNLCIACRKCNNKKEDLFGVLLEWNKKPKNKNLKYLEKIKMRLWP